MSAPRQRLLTPAGGEPAYRRAKRRNTMPNARALPEATNRRAVLGAVLAAGALVAIPAETVAADLDQAEPELHALIAAWHETSRRSQESFEALLAASARAICPVPQSLIATESDASQWSRAVAGEQYHERDMDTLRPWMNMSRRSNHPPLPGNVLPGSEFDDRGREIIASWDRWQAEKGPPKIAKESSTRANFMNRPSKIITQWVIALQNYGRRRWQALSPSSSPPQPRSRKTI